MCVQQNLTRLDCELTDDDMFSIIFVLFRIAMKSNPSSFEPNLFWCTRPHSGNHRKLLNVRREGNQAFYILEQNLNLEELKVSGGISYSNDEITFYERPDGNISEKPSPKNRLIRNKLIAGICQ